MYKERTADIDILVTSRNGHRKVIESSNFASYRAIMSGWFNSRKDLRLTKFDSKLIVKLSFRELCD